MAQSLVNIYIHLVFSTKNRHPFIDENIEEELYKYLGGICDSLGCSAIKIGGHTDHIHILCKLSKKTTIVKLLEEVKKSSSKWVKTKGDSYKRFYWQDGYSAFSVNPKEINIVIRYIENQKEHHKKKSFQEELRQFFKNYKMDYDERYVWD